MNSLTAQSVIASGYCGGEGDGTNLTWILTADSVLTISGRGEMANYGYNPQPWSPYSYTISEIIIGNLVTSIGDYAFTYCSSLTLVTIPNSVTSIGEAPFASCSRLIAIEVNIDNRNYSDLDGILYDKVQNTLVCCPAGKTGSLSIPNSVTSIGDRAFYSCYNLTSVTIGNSVTSIGDGAFSYCDGLISVTIGNSVTSIGTLAFSSCYRLTSVTIPNSVTSIGDGAFTSCSGLTSVTIPNSVTSIGYRTFSDCYNLTSVMIPNSVTSIGILAFSGCYNLTSVTIGNSVTNIGNGAFSFCINLTTITCLANVPPTLGSEVFYDVLDTIPVCVPSGSVAAYQASDWNYFTNIDGCATAVSEISRENASVKVYPNPTTGKVYLSVESNIRIYSIQGTLLHETFGSEADLSGYPQGVYFLKAGNKTVKIVKE